MVTKVSPFFDDFNDANNTGWTVISGTWDMSNADARNNLSSTVHTTMQQYTTDEDIEVSFDYTRLGTGGEWYIVYPRWEDGPDRVAVWFNSNESRLYKYISGVWTQVAQNTSAGATKDVAYSARIVCDGDNIKVYWGEKGDVETEIFDETDTDFDLPDQKKVQFLVSKNAEYATDNVRILANDLSNTTTMTYNGANELLTLADRNGTTTYTYDENGRMTGRTRGGQSATYTYDYDDRMLSAVSNFPDESDVSYTYGGNGQRRSRTENGVTTNLNWIGWSLASEENDSSGDLLKTYLGPAEISGSNPSTGAYSYYMTDHLGSPRAVFDQSKILLASQEFTPFGSNLYNSNSGLTNVGFTGHYLNSATNMYATMFRWYSPEMSRWTTTDPLGMIDGPNIYAYVGNSPTVYLDPTGALRGTAIGGGAGALGGAAGNLVKCGPGRFNKNSIFEGAAYGAAAGSIFDGGKALGKHVWRNHRRGLNGTQPSSAKRFVDKLSDFLGKAAAATAAFASGYESDGISGGIKEGAESIVGGPLDHFADGFMKGLGGDCVD